MTTQRREFLKLAAGTAVFAPAARWSFADTGSEIKAVLFDAFPVFNPGPIFARVEELFPGKGMELGELWRNRQFEYTWLRSLAQRYENFWDVTESALVFAAQTLKIDLTAEKRDRLMQAYLELKPWPEVLPALKSLKAAGLRLAFLSNFTHRMLDSCIQASGLQGMFEHVLSTDDVKTYKPDPRAYQMGLDAFGFSRGQTAFVAFAGWDAAGAKWFGYPTFWANRRGQPAAEMGVQPDVNAADLSGLLKFVRP
jgi:2-haloacid dehalogenase